MERVCYVASVMTISSMWEPLARHAKAICQKISKHQRWLTWGGFLHTPVLFKRLRWLMLTVIVLVWVMQLGIWCHSYSRSVERAQGVGREAFALIGRGEERDRCQKVACRGIEAVLTGGVVVHRWRQHPRVVGRRHHGRGGRRRGVIEHALRESTCTLRIGVATELWTLTRVNIACCRGCLIIETISRLCFRLLHRIRCGWLLLTV